MEKATLSAMLHDFQMSVERASSVWAKIRENREEEEEKSKILMNGMDFFFVQYLQNKK